MDLGEPFGSQLRRRRATAGVSLAELARRTHYSTGYLSKIETGARPPTVGDLAVTDSATVRCDVRALARTLTRWPAHPSVRQLHPELTAALHRPNTYYR